MNETVRQDLEKLKRIGVLRGWSIAVKSETEIVVHFTQRSGSAISTLSALFQVDDYPFKPPSVRFLDPEKRAVNGIKGWPCDLDQMFKTAPTWQGGPFICLRGVREYHAYPGHSQEPIDPKLNRLASICNRIQDGIDMPNFRGRIS